MFSRLIASRNLFRITKHIFVTQQHAHIIKCPTIVQTHRAALHIKVYDKDAGLDTKRAANELVQNDDIKQADAIEKTESHRLRRRRGKTVGGLGQKNAVEVSLNANNVVESVTSEKSLHVKDIIENNDDPDVFGGAPKEPPKEDEGDLEEEQYISRPTRRSKKLSTREYARMIKEHFNNHRVKEALEVVEIRMLKEDRVKPENYIYNILISGCAKAGYTRKAFQLYTKMRQRGLKVKESTYTSLFNACANAPSYQDGLTRAIRLKESLLQKGYEFNVKNYNAMIKAFGRWGDVKTAYVLADEMRDKNLPMTGETFNFLLQACASDEKHGFRHCLLTWHRMLQKGIEPDYYTFDAVLRCVRDCGFGDLDTMEKVLQQILTEAHVKQMPAKTVKTVESSETNVNSKLNAVESIDNTGSTAKVGESETDLTVPINVNENALNISTQSTSLELPNLLAPQPHLGSMVSLMEVHKPHERFLLVGGLNGFLELMKSKNITPNIQIFTTMLEVIPPTNTAEKQLITYVRKIGLKADIDFFNILIKKRAMRFDYEGGKEVLNMIRTAGLQPDIVTYGVLALGCTTLEECRELLEQMRQKGIRMNIQILGAMLRQGCARKHFAYVCEMMQLSLDENIRPNDAFLRHLHNFYLHCARAIDARHHSTKQKTFRKEHKKFCDKYRLYQEEHNIDGLKLEDAIKKIKERPYDQYKEDNVEGVESLKNEKLARKKKLRKYIKKIKLEHLNGAEDTLDTGTKRIENTLTKDEENDTGKNVPNSVIEKVNTNNPFRIS